MNNISVRDPDGIYKYVNGKWETVDSLRVDRGVHVVYFDNKECIACRVFDPEWFATVKKLEEQGIQFWVVLCSWFNIRCESKEAKDAFRKYNVTASPTILIIVDGEISEIIKGVVKSDELEAYINTVISGSNVPTESKHGFVC